MRQYATEVKSATGETVMRSKNLRAMLRYGSVSPVAKVRATPNPANQYNGKLSVEYRDGSTCEAHFASHTVLLEWLDARQSWRGAAWDVDAPIAKHLDQRSISALERLHKKGQF
jgi:hypothetical protein